MAQPQNVALTAGRVRDLVSAFLRAHPEHRSAFLADPAAALKRHLGVVLRSPTVLAVVETPGTVHVVVPADPNELGEADLGRVAGGTGTLAAADESVEARITRVDAFTVKQGTSER